MPRLALQPGREGDPGPRGGRPRAESAAGVDNLSPEPRSSARALLRARDFRLLYGAVTTSKLGDALHYVALMWIALEEGGPLGVVVVRLAGSIPVLLFGFHGGVLADRLDRRKLVVAADLARAAVLVPLAVAGLAGHLPLWGLVVAAILLSTADSYFEPAYGALLPGVVQRANVQQANALIRMSTDVVWVLGWSVAAALLAFVPLSVFFAIDALSYLVSAALLVRVRAGLVEDAEIRPRVREGLAVLRRHGQIAVAVAALGVGVTIASGAWMVGVPELVRTDLGRGAASFSLVSAAYAAGSIAAGIFIIRRGVRRKALTSVAAWSLYLPAYALFAVADSLATALAAGAAAGVAQAIAMVLLASAAQEEIADRYLGRVMGLIALLHRGGHATGLLVIGPLFAVLSADTVFAAVAVALPIVSLTGIALAVRLAPTGAAARARATG